MDEWGFYGTHYAAIGGRDVIIKILLKAGADVNAKMKNNNTPLHMAILGGAKKDALLALLEGGANDNVGMAEVRLHRRCRISKSASK